MALAALEEDEHLLLQVKGTNRYVQFMDQGGYGRRVETVSDYYLDLAWPLPLEDVAVMAVLTLIHVHCDSHPGELEYEVRSGRGMSVRFPHLVIRRRVAAG